VSVDKFGKFNKSVAESMASRFGFQNVKNTEKFIMNFRVHKILSSEMECCLRGGLCTPFYATNPKAKRVSIDLDLFMEDTRESAISKIVGVLKGRGLKIVPRKPRRVKNLLQMDLKYDTTRLLHDEKEHMRIDVMYGVDLRPPTHTPTSAHSLSPAHTYTHTPAHTHAHTHTHTHTHTRTKQKQSKVPSCLNKVTLPGKSRMPVH